jgi:hypothetical protein
MEPVMTNADLDAANAALRARAGNGDLQILVV